MTTFYSDDLKKWYVARDYQHTELAIATKMHFPYYPNIPYQSKNANAIFQLSPCNNNTYIMTRPNNTNGYLLWSPHRRLRANADMAIIYSGTKIIIKKGYYYYVHVDNPSIPVVGWHGSIDPPLDMGDNPIVSFAHLLTKNIN
jgi:hypothetical protein